MRPVAGLVFSCVLTAAPLALAEPAEETGSYSAEREHEAATEETLIKGKVVHGGYGAPEVRVTTMFNEPAVLAGAQGGWIMNHSLVMGAAFYGTAREAPADVDVPRMQDPYVAIAYGGARFGFVFFPMRLVHFTVATLVGGGAANVTEMNQAMRDSDTAEPDHTDGFFVVEPEAALEINLWRHTRLALGASYRFVTPVDSELMSSDDLSGPSAGLAVKFGSF